MPSKRIEIFTKASISLKISLKCHEFLKNFPFSKDFKGDESPKPHVP
jgi:hypothetical protein